MSEAAVPFALSTIRQVAEMIRRLLDAGAAMPIAANVAMRALRDEQFVPAVLALLDELERGSEGDRTCEEVEQGEGADEGGDSPQDQPARSIPGLADDECDADAGIAIAERRQNLRQQAHRDALDGRRCGPRHQGNAVGRVLRGRTARIDRRPWRSYLVKPASSALTR